MKIIFFGTPEFAAIILSKLIEKNKEILGVVSVPDKPAGRGLKLRESPVSQVARLNNLLLFKPSDLKDSAFLDKLKSLEADVFLVIAFRKLPPEVWNMPPLGTINLHASLLPQYRGAAPIHHAVMNGETITGLTTFFINDHLDTGGIILQKEIPISYDDTAGDIYEKMILEAPDLIVDTLEWLNFHSVKDAIPQTLHDSFIKKAPKLTTQNTEINWKLDCQTIRNFIRGLSPSPGAWSKFEKLNHQVEVWKILNAQVQEVNLSHSTIPGSLWDMQNQLHIACANGWIIPLKIQQEGRKILDNETFLRGLKNRRFHLNYLTT